MLAVRASDFYELYYPSHCERRIWLRAHEVAEAEPSALSEVVMRMGIEHEVAHAKSLPGLLNLKDGTIEERAAETRRAILDRVPAIYQGVLQATLDVDGQSIRVIGSPDFLLRNADGYVIRDAKLSANIELDNHLQVHRQLALYGWLFSRVAGEAPVRLEVLNRRGELVESQPDWNATMADIRTLVRNRSEEGFEPYSPVGWTKCSACSFRDTHCWQRAIDNHEPGVVPDVDQGLAMVLNDIGIRTYDEIAKQFSVDTLEELVRPKGTHSQKVGIRAEAIFHEIAALQSGRAIILRDPDLPPGSTWVMFDVEAIPFSEENPVEVYLWGTQTWTKSDPTTPAIPGEYLGARSGSGPTGDEEGWRAFLENVASLRHRYGAVSFVHWAPYEKTRIREYIARYGDHDGVAEWLTGQLFDLLSEVRFCAVFPLPSYSLKVVEQYVGFARALEEYGGDWSIAQYLNASTESDRQQALDRITEYNREDLQATWAVFEWLSQQQVSAPVFQNLPPLPKPVRQIAETPSIRQHSGLWPWSTIHSTTWRWFASYRVRWLGSVTGSCTVSFGVPRVTNWSCATSGIGSSGPRREGSPSWVTPIPSSA